MATKNGRQYTGVAGIDLDPRNGVIRFNVPTIAPTTTSGERLLYIDSSGNLIYNDGTGSVTLGAAGGAGNTPTFETLFAADATMTLTPDQTFTIAGNHATATAVLTLTNIGGGSGAVLAFSNSGSGKDVLGTSSTWDITKAGVATFAGVSISGTTSAIATTGAAVWTLLDNSATSLSIDASGTTGLLLFDTRNGAEVISSTATIFHVSAGQLKATTASNTVSSLLLTNNTATTFGADANSSGVAVIQSTSLTTGSLLQLQLTEGTLNGGFYLTCRDVTAGANVFTLGEDGAVVIAGAGGSNMLTVTAGDVVLSDASLAITDADNAASLSMTNNTATSAAVVVFAGSGVFTGTTTTSFMTITQSGGTAGTTLYVSGSAATTSVAVVDLAAAALTSGSLLRITPGSATLTTGGKSIEVVHGSAVAGNGLTVTTTGAYTGTGLVLLTAGAATTGVLLSLVSTTGMTSGSLLRMTTSTAGAVATNGICSIRATGNYTSTSNVGLLDVAADSTTGGTVVRVSGAAVTDGTLLHIAAVEATLTTGKYINCYDGAASDFSVGKYGATVIAGNASGTAALTLTAGDIVVTSGLLSVSGLVTLTAGITGKVIWAGTEDIAAGGTTTALALTVSQHTIACDAGGDTFTLANGVNGQVMTILCKAVNGGTCTITPTTFAQGTSITFNAIGDAVMLQYATTTGWFIIGGNSYAIV